MSAYATSASPILRLTSAPASVRRILARAGLADLPLSAVDLQVETVRDYDQQEVRVTFTAPPRDVNLFALLSPVLDGVEPKGCPAAAALPRGDIAWWHDADAEPGAAPRVRTVGLAPNDEVVEVVRGAERVWIRILS